MSRKSSLSPLPAIPEDEVLENSLETDIKPLLNGANFEYSESCTSCCDFGKGGTGTDNKALVDIINWNFDSFPRCLVK